jgi:hypothetical protein
MELKYIIVPHGKREAPKKFYAQAKSKGELMFRKLRRKITEKFSAVIGKLPIAGKQSDKYIDFLL